MYLKLWCTFWQPEWMVTTTISKNCLQTDNSTEFTTNSTRAGRLGAPQHEKDGASARDIAQQAGKNLQPAQLLLADWPVPGARTRQQWDFGGRATNVPGLYSIWEETPFTEYTLSSLCFIQAILVRIPKVVQSLSICLLSILFLFL